MIKAGKFTIKIIKKFPSLLKIILKVGKYTIIIYITLKLYKKGKFDFILEFLEIKKEPTIEDDLLEKINSFKKDFYYLNKRNINNKNRLRIYIKSISSVFMIFQNDDLKNLLKNTKQIFIKHCSSFFKKKTKENIQIDIDEKLINSILEELEKLNMGTYQNYLTMSGHKPHLR